MEFSIEFYENKEGKCPVREFLDDLKASDPDDFAAVRKAIIMKTNFDLYLEEQLKNPDFAARFAKAGEAWDIAVQIAALRQEAGLSQRALARKLKTSQQQISRIESPSYEGHSLSMLRRVAHTLGAEVHVVLERSSQRRLTGAGHSNAQ